jgi:predicted ribonuclease YlaK
LERGRGENFSVDEIKEFTRRGTYIRNSERPAELTLREVLLRELEIVQTVKDGMGSCLPLAKHLYTADPKLDDEQHQALDKLLLSTNAVSLFRGGAGTGKSFVLRELVRQVQSSGKRVVVLAPQRQQVVDMERAGFPSPTTVTNFLLKGDDVEGTVIVIDEAGQIGGRQMAELLRLARERNARVILSGDTRQHGAVEASDALLAIERHSGIRPVELHTIRRQDAVQFCPSCDAGSLKIQIALIFQ